jgi:ABC-2 type transport system permease protein
MTAAPAVAVARPRAIAGHGALTGTGALTLLALRRDRIMLPAWVYVVVVGVASAYGARCSRR